MKQSKKTLYVVIDALRADYVRFEKMPKLTELAEKSIHVEELIPSPGFCERVEILTGMENEETGYFTAIDRVDPAHKTPFSFGLVLWMSNLLKMVECLLNSYMIFRVRKRLTNSLIRKLWPQYRVPAFNIPLSIYGQFDLSEDAVDQSVPSAFGVPSIVDRRAKRGETVNFRAFTSLADTSSLLNDQDRLKYIEDNFHTSKDEVFFLYVGELDAMGHKHGPSSSDFIDILKSFDQSLNQFIERLNAKGDFELVIIGDHGMSDVTSSVNFVREVRQEGERLGLTRKSDITIFCDSTVGRVWVKNEKKMVELRDSLRENEQLKKSGIIFEDQDYKKFSVPKNLEKHGQILWFANNGVILSPDYFYGGFPPKGMHGYLPIVSENFGMAIFSGDRINARKIPRAKLSDVPAIYEETFG